MVLLPNKIQLESGYSLWFWTSMFINWNVQVTGTGQMHRENQKNQVFLFLVQHLKLLKMPLNVFCICSSRQPQKVGVGFVTYRELHPLTQGGRPLLLVCEHVLLRLPRTLLISGDTVPLFGGKLLLSHCNCLVQVRATSDTLPFWALDST